MKVILATGSPEIDKRLQLSENHTLVDNVGDLTELMDLLNYISVDILIVNMLLDDAEGELLIGLANTAFDKNIKIVMLTEKIESYAERILVSKLANLSVHAFITFEKLNNKVLESVLSFYPEKFDFGLLAETIIKEKPVTVKEEKIIERIVNFHNKVITVVGNAELAAELAAVAGRNCDKNVMLIDFDFFDSGMDAALGIENQLKDLPDVFELIENGSLDRRKLEQCCIKLNKVKVFSLIPKFSQYKYSELMNKPISQLIDFAYKNYDLTLVHVNGSCLDLCAISVLQNTDHILITMHGDRISRRQAENYTIYMRDTHGIGQDKFHFVLFEYNEKTDALLGYFNANLPSMACISYSEKRCRFRNSKASYALRINGRNLEEYLKLLSTFKISESHKNNNKSKIFLKKILGGKNGKKVSN